jgi:hypothetical protein
MNHDFKNRHCRWCGFHEDSPQGRGPCPLSNRIALVVGFVGAFVCCALFAAVVFAVVSDLLFGTNLTTIPK